jgi:hypothetical protein
MAGTRSDEQDDENDAGRPGGKDLMKMMGGIKADSR